MHRIPICCCSITDCALAADIRPLPTSVIMGFHDQNDEKLRNPGTSIFFLCSSPSSTSLWPFRRSLEEEVHPEPHPRTLPTGDCSICKPRTGSLAGVEFQQPCRAFKHALRLRAKSRLPPRLCTRRTCGDLRTSMLDGRPW